MSFDRRFIDCWVYHDLIDQDRAHIVSDKSRLIRNFAMLVRILIVLTSLIALTGCNDSVIRNNITIKASEVLMETATNALIHPSYITKSIQVQQSNE